MMTNTSREGPMSSYISGIIKNTFGMSSPDSLRPTSRTASSPVWSAEPGSFIISGNKKINERFPAPGNIERAPLRISPAPDHRSSKITVSTDSAASLAEPENTAKGLTPLESNVSNSLNLTDGYDHVVNEDKKEHKEVISTQEYLEGTVRNQPDKILNPDGEFKEDQNIPEMPGKDIFKERLSNNDDASKTIAETTFHYQKKRIKIDTAASEIQPGETRAGYIIKNDLEPVKLPSEKPLKNRIPYDAYTESDRNMIPGSAIKEKQPIPENNRKTVNSENESPEKQISELNPVKPTLPIREMPSIVQTKLVIGKLTVEVINPPEEKAPSVQVKGINNYIPVSATPTSESFSSGIKVKFGLGQL